jgi:putative transposase
MPVEPVKRAFKYRFYPTSEQADQLIRTFGCVRYVWNRALAERTAAFYERQERMSYVACARRLTEWKQTEEAAFLYEVSNVPLQQVLRHQERAFANFFAKRSRYPQFKSKHRSKPSATYSASGFSFRGGQLNLARMSEPLEIKWSRPLPADVVPTTATVSRDPSGRWFVSLLCEDRINPLPTSTSSVGIDLGITALATLSTGEKITNHRHYERDRRKLKRAQQSLSRKQKGSKNRSKARRRVAKLHARIADRRRDQLQKLTTRLVRENQAIAIEDLNVSGMVKNRHLSRAISDVGWHELRRQLEYKCDWYGRRCSWCPAGCRHRNAVQRAGTSWPQCLYRCVSGREPAVQYTTVTSMPHSTSRPPGRRFQSVETV